MRARLTCLIFLMLFLPAAAVAADNDAASFSYTTWSGTNWYGLYSAYGEGHPEQEKAVRAAALALRKGEGFALAELKPIAGPDCTDPVVLLMYGYLLNRSGDAEGADDALGRGAAEAARPGQSEWVRTWVRGACLQWQTYNAFYSSRQYIRTLELARAALEAYPPCPEREELEKNIPAIESLAETQRKGQQALANAAEALKSAPSEGDDDALKTKILADIEKIILSGDNEAALEISTRAVGNWPEDAMALHRHQTVLGRLKRWREAEAFGKRAIEAAERDTNLELAFDIMQRQFWIAWTDWHADRSQGTKKRMLEEVKIPELVARMQEIAEELDDNDRRYNAMYIRGDLCESYIGERDYRKAAKMFENLHAFARKNGWKDRIKGCERKIAECYACSGDLEESKKWSKIAGTSPHPFIALQLRQWDKLYEERWMIDHYERQTVRQPNERLQREMFGWNQRGPFDKTIISALHLGKQEVAIETAERLHNRTIGIILGARAEAGRSAVVTKRKEREAAVEATMAELRRQLAAAERTDTAAVESIQRDLTVQGAALAQLHADIAVDELEIKAAGIPPPMKVADMQALLDDDTALLVYATTWTPWIGEGLVSAVTREGIVTHLSPDLFIGSYENEGFQRNMDPYLPLIAKPTLTPEEKDRLKFLNDDLYYILITPLIEKIEKCRHWIIVPSGPLCQVPIHLLRDKAGKYVFESHSISYIPSVGVLKHALSRNRQVGGDVTVVANPALAAANASLKFAELEAKTITDVFPTANLLMGDRATETAVKDSLATADVLHFACHGMLNSDFPMRSALALTPDDANDGLLTAREVCDYPVNAGLVVLSACESGSGGMSAGWIELVGMNRGWLLAGAPSVMTALWKLDDRSTSELMGEFYKNLKTMGRAEALQKAQLTMMKKYDSPYYWGAFVLYGDYR